MFADLELTVGLPPAVTAATGIDALTHNVRATCRLSPAVRRHRRWRAPCIAARAPLTAVNEPEPAGTQRHDDGASMMGAIAPEGSRGRALMRAHALGAVNDLHHGSPMR